MAGQRRGQDERSGQREHGVRGGASMAAWWRYAAAVVVTSGLWACSLADETQLPPNVQDPGVVKTPSGALARYRNALAQVGPALDYVIMSSGLITDELAALPVQANIMGSYSLPDSRVDLASLSGINVGRLHRLRAQAREARGFVSAYLPDTNTALSKPALMAHMLVLEAYAEVWLADLFCSGIPLSTVDFEAHYTLASGSTTDEVYRHAAALFDSALVLENDSARVQHAAAVGHGRALLALGRYAEAAEAVRGVPDDYRYEVPFDVAVDSATRTLWHFHEKYDSAPGTPSAADREGMNGLDYRSSGDPRTLSTLLGTDKLGNAMYFPAKYDGMPTVYVLASGVEARLIEAEAALQAGDVAAWLTALNQLRFSGRVLPTDTIADTLGVTGCSSNMHCGKPLSEPGGSDPSDGQPPDGFPVPPGYTFAYSYVIDPVSQAVRDHCWQWSNYLPCRENFITTVDVYVRPEAAIPGTGGVAGLSMLNDPGTPSARLDLMFRERAFWLYLTGHRQGDLRRLVRLYPGRSVERVYPTGLYPGASGSYGDELVIPVPDSERELNPHYTGCFHRNA